MELLPSSRIWALAARPCIYICKTRPSTMCRRVLSKGNQVVLCPRTIHQDSRTARPGSFTPGAGIYWKERLESGAKLGKNLWSDHGCNVAFAETNQPELSRWILFLVYRRKSSLGICWFYLRSGGQQCPVSIWRDADFRSGKRWRDGRSHLLQGDGTCEQRLHWNMQAIWARQWFGYLDVQKSSLLGVRSAGRNKCVFLSHIFF